MLADPWGLGTQRLPQSIALRLIAFLILVNLHKQACDAASNKKSLSREIGTGFVASPRIELGFGVSETHVLSIILRGYWTNLGKIN